MKRYLVSILTLLVLAGLTALLLCLLVCLLLSKSFGAFLQAAALPLLIVLVAAYAAGNSNRGGGWPAIP